MQYSTFLQDLQGDSEDEEKNTEKTYVDVEIPGQENSAHFKKFEIKFRNKESREDAKLILTSLEKEKLLLSLIPLAFNDNLEGEAQTFSLFVEKDNSLQIIWEFILASFRFFGEPEGISKCYYAEFIRLDKFFMENSTLPMADSEIIVDIFKFCINANVNLHEFRNIEFPHANSTTDRLDTDVVMEESHMPRVSDLIGSSSLADLILTPAEKQMDTWKPNSTKIIQLFQDFDNEGFDVSKLFFDILQNSKLRYMQNKEIHLFGLEFTENASAGNWASRSVENFKTIVLPKNFEELQNVPLDKPYNFLMSLDKSSIDKEISILGIEALMFWELPKVDLALSNMCRKWFFNECKAYKKNYLDLTKPESDNDGESVEIANAGNNTKKLSANATENTENIELGFIEKLLELWKLRKRIHEAKAEISVKGTLSRYNYRTGEAIMNKTMDYRSSFMKSLFKERCRAITKDERKRVALIMYENYICQYKALLLQCEQEFEIMINVRLYQEIIVPLFQIKHGQFAAVALSRGGATKLLKKVWEAFIVRRDRLVLKEEQKSLQTKQRFENQLKAAQQSAGAQIDARCDANLANVDDRVKRIIQETVKSQSIKKDALAINISTLSNMDNTLGTTGNFNTINLIPHSVKRNRPQDMAIDLRSPNEIRKKKSTNNNAAIPENSSRIKGFCLIFLNRNILENFHNSFTCINLFSR